jgi:hypothetical protein
VEEEDRPEGEGDRVNRGAGATHVGAGLRGTGGYQRRGATQVQVGRWKGMRQTDGKDSKVIS